MVSVKKVIVCKCGASNTFEFTSDMSIEDITVSGYCPSCGRGISIALSALLFGGPAQVVPVSETPVENAPSEAETRQNIESAVRELFK
jgi:hypothetical protein